MKPNLLFVLADQLRPDFLGCYGAGFVRTPNLDALARRGVVFGQAYSPHPVCVAARAALLTGMHSLRTGVLDNGLFLRPDRAQAGIATWPELLTGAGYHTAAIGKMHFYPWDLRLGFQYRRVAEDKRWLQIRDDYWHFLRRNGHRKYHGQEHAGYHEWAGAIVNKLPWELQVDHWVGQETCDFIRAHGQDGPWALMVGFPGPHCPYDPDPRFMEGLADDAMPDPVPDAGDTPGLLQRCIAGNRRPWNGVDYSSFTRPQKLRIRRHYAALVQQIDVAMCQVLRTLDEQGLSDETVIVFTSDHGDYLGDHGMIGKGTFYQSSWHVPLIVALPGATARRSDELVSLSDVTATLLELAGVERPGNMDAQPLPLEAGAGRDHLIGALADSWCIQRERWRLAKYGTGEATLFDLAEDPREQRNLAEDPAHHATYRRLDAELTSAAMRLTLDAHAPERVYANDLSQDEAFGREGWQRLHPRPVGGN